MTTYNTGNPLGSSDPRDLYDNAENLDHAVNSDNETWQDRFDRSRRTLAGMESEFNADQSSREQEFRTFIASSGYQFAGEYAAEIEITQYNQIIRDSNGEFWRVSGQVDLPYTTTGTGLPEDDAFVPAGDAVIRQDLANPDKGAAMVARGVVAVDGIADLLALPASALSEDKSYYVKSVGRSYTWSSIEGLSLSYDVFIIFGQSNAVGHATPPNDFSKPKEFPEPIDGDLCLYWDKNEQALLPIVYDMPHARTSISRGHAWSAFANKYAKETGRGVILLPAAQGGASLEDLSVGSTTFTFIEDQINNLNSYIIDNEVNVGSRSVIFHQGETDQLEEVSRDAYQVQLQGLLSYLRSNHNIGITFLSLVGNPQNREETTWQAIQAAQEYVCASLPWAVLAYAGFGSFTVQGRLLRDGVHATQLGYNMMGEGIASSVVDTFKFEYPSPTSELALSRYGVPLLPSDQIWRKAYMTIGFDSNLNDWVAFDKENSYFRSSYFCEIELLSGSSSRIRFHLNAKASAVLSLSASANLRAFHDGVNSVSTSFFDNANSSGQRSGYGVDVFIHKDLRFIVSPTGEIRTYPNRNSATVDASLNGVSTTILSDGSVMVDHPRMRGVASVSTLVPNDFATNSSVSVARSTDNTKTIFKVSGDASDVVVSLTKCLIDPLDASDGWEITAEALFAEARY